MTQQSNTHENKNHRRLPPSLTPKISSTTPSEVTSTLPPTKNILSIAKAIIVTASWQSYPRPSAHQSSPHPSLPREILTRRTCREEGAEDDRQKYGEKCIKKIGTSGQIKITCRTFLIRCVDISRRSRYFRDVRPKNMLSVRNAVY